MRKGVLIRKASDADCTDIQRINNNLILGRNDKKHGFVLGALSETIPVPEFFVAQDKETQKILGFVQIKSEIEDSTLAHVKPTDVELNDYLQKRHYFYINKVCVDSGYLAQGIGKELYRFLFAHFQGTLMTFIATKPFLNERSLRFHEAMGFRPAGIFEKEEFMGLSLYQSVLLMRRKL